MSGKLQFIFLFNCLIFLGVFSSCNNEGDSQHTNQNDWQYKAESYDLDRNQVLSHSRQRISSSSAQAFMSKSNNNIGFSVGGAKDINNFRENITNNFLPLATDITYEGLFYDYFFDTGITKACDKLFCPSYTSALSKDPFSKKEEYFLSVGLNSGIAQKDFSRKKLNLVIVIDISGSMEEEFDRYYYDQYKKDNSEKKLLTEESEKKLFTEDTEEDFSKTKLQAASESVVALLDHLNPEDSFGVVLFDDSAHLGRSLKKVEDTNLKNIKDHILKLESQGGTNMSSGMEMATKLFQNYSNTETFGKVENRIIFLTDAEPNRGMTDEGDLLAMLKANAKQKIYTSFIGIGVDFNTELIEIINKVSGANYYAVHSPSQFKKRMDDEFDFMVTPLVFDLKLKIEAPGFKIKKAYGSPEADEATGEIMKVATLFPSQRTDEETRGGIILLHLEKVTEAENHTIQLIASYKDREGKVDSGTVKFEFKKGSEFYDNTGIRKGLLLSRYVNLLKNWIVHERSHEKNTEEEAKNKKKLTLESLETDGISVLSDEAYQLGEWERQSIELSVSKEYKKLFSEFYSYFEKEMKEIGDSSMDKELKILKTLKDHNNSAD